MARTLPSTLADYVVVGINPALIMVLIASVVFFLVDLFFPCNCACAQDLWCNARLKFIFAMFIMGTVAVGRISMEEGTGYAAMFAAPLACAAFIAINAFVKLEGSFTALSPFINIGLMALVWWLSYQLTWDCTVMEDRADTSDQGLLAAFGADEPLPEDGAESAEPELYRTDQPLIRQVLENPLPWLKKIWERSRQPHAHGLWIIYFAMGALPIFGFGGWFSQGRSAAFAMLVMYVATSLALLLSTSFLGLRRYLRRRHVEMPVEMTAVWLAVGGIMIVGVLLACVLLPRPGAEVAISQIPLPTFSSPWQTPSRFGTGNDGRQPSSQTRPGQSWWQKLTRQNAEQESKSSEQPAEAGEQSSAGAAKDQPGAPGEKSTAEQQQSSGKQSGEGKQDASQGEKSDSQAKNSGNSEASGEKNSSSSQSNPQRNSQSVLKKKAEAKEQGKEKEKSEQQSKTGQSTKSGNSSSQNSQAKSPRSGQNSQTSASPPPAKPTTPPTPSFNPWQLIGAFFTFLGVLLKLLFYAAIVLAVIYYARKYWPELQAAWRQLQAELQALWKRWFGKPEPILATIIEPPLRLKAFSEFANPFAQGQPRLSATELVQYTFEAIQVWGRENGCPRAAFETPHEYLERLSEFFPHLEDNALSLAEYYGYAAYSGGHVPASCVEPLRSLWFKMNESPVSA